MKNYYVYAHTCLVNGKVYIGQTYNPKKRWWEHCSSNDGTVFHKAIKKYGRERFEMQILFESIDFEEVKQKEIELIAELNTTIPRGYNMTIGGDGVIPTEAGKAKAAARTKRDWEKDPKRRKAQSDLMKKNNPMKRPEIVAKLKGNTFTKGMKNPGSRKNCLENNPMWDPKIVAKGLKTKALNKAIREAESKGDIHEEDINKL